MTFRAGIVGCGRIGCEFDDDPKRTTISTHAGAYAAVEGIDLVAACDLNNEKLDKCGKRWRIPSLYEDFREMLRNENLDILSICTWNSTHLDIVREATNSGVKAIFCEKPIAESIKSADEILKLCNAKGVILQIDHQRRFDQFHQDVRRFLQSGKLGRIQQLSFYYTAGIANTGSHMFDLLRFFFGDVDWVQTIYSKNKSPNSEDPNIDGMMMFRKGVLCSIQACDVQSFLIFEIDCIGAKGRLRITHSGFGLDFYEVGESRLYSGYEEIFPAPAPIETDTPREFMVASVRHLLECVRERKMPISSGDDGHAALELICAFHESARGDGKRITLPLKDSDIEINSR